MARAPRSQQPAWRVVASDDRIRTEMEAFLRDAGFVVLEATGAQSDPPRGQVAVAVQLSPRERDVLAALAAFDAVQEMARHLSISPRTVEHHLQGLMRKFGVRARHRVIVEAVRQGWLSLETDRSA
jgi:DNA-binding CsgD family transcriptional regulator